MAHELVSRQALLDEIAALRGRLAEAEDTLIAIRQDEVDAFVTARPGGNQIVTLAGADYPYRAMVENMSEGAATLIADGTIFYCNPRFAEMTRAPQAELTGSLFQNWFAADEHDALEAVLREVGATPVRGEFRLRGASGPPVPVQLSIHRLNSVIPDGISIVVTDITERQRAEQALARNEQRFRALIEKSSDLITLLDVEGTVLYTSPIIAQIVGGTPKDWLGGHFLNRVHPDDAARVEDLVKHLLELPGGSLTCEFRYRRLDETWRWLAATATNLLAEPAVAAIVANVRDITEQKRAAEALRLEHALLARVMDTSPVSILRVDRQGQIVFANLRAEQVLDLTHKEPEQRAYNTPPWRITDFDGQPISDQAQPFQQVLATGQPVQNVRNAINWPDGRRAMLSINAAPLYDADGQMDGIVAAIEDITELSRAEAQRAQLAAIVESSDDAIIGENLAGIIVSWNAGAERLFGYPAQDIIGQSMSRLAPPDRQDELPDGLARLARGEHIQHLETERVRQDGTRLAVSVSLSPIIDSAGRMVGASAIDRDITGRKLAEDQLRFQAGMLAAAGQAVIATDPNGTILYWNHMAEKMYGWRADEALGKDAGQVLTTSASAEQGLQIFQQVQAGATWTGEFMVQRRDGTHFPAQVTDTPFFDAQGRLAGIIGLSTDISERKQAELAEREQRVLAEALRDTAAALNTTLDLDVLLGRILENAGRVVPHEAANIMLLEGSRVRIATGHGFTERGTGAAGLGQSFQMSELRNIQEMFKTGQPLIIPDLAAYPGWVVVPGTEWFRSFAGAPIRVQGQIIGFITLNSGTPGFFTPTHAERLKAFADQAGSALENARLLAETRQRLGELEAVAQVSTALRGAQTVEAMLPMLMNSTLSILAMGAGAIWLVDSVSGDLCVSAAGGWQPPALRVRPGEGPVGLAFASGEPYISSEFKTDARASASMAHMPTGLGGANIPLRTASGIIGVLSVGTRLPREITASETRLLTTIADIAGTAIHRLQLSEQTERRLQRLAALRAIDLAISSSLDLNVTLQVLLDQVITQLGVDAAVVRLTRPQTQLLEYAAGRGFHATAIDHPRLRLGQGYAGRAALNRQTLALPDLSLDTPDPARAAALAAAGYQAYYGVPLVAKGAVHGVLEIFNRAPLHPDVDWLDFMEALAGQAAIAIDNTQLFNDLQRSNLDLSLAYDATIEGWSRALDLRDKETEGHTLRVTEMSLRLARSLGLSEADLVHFRRGALLHDIGKMGVPDRILLKPGSLTDDEWVIMKLHPTFAHDMLSPIQYLRPALDIPYCHHEKWDGTGYPRGLAGELIPLTARIFAVVDVWDALRSMRPYRPAWPEEKIRQHIRALSGTHFDPRVVDVFEALLAAQDNGSAGYDTFAAHQPAVLVVDDESNVTRSLERSLRGAFTVFTANSGTEALAILAREKIAVIIADQRMPGLTGLQLLQQAHTLSPATRGLLVSAYSESAALAETLNLSSVRGYIPKPWQPDDLARQISAAAEEYSTLLRDQQVVTGRPANDA